MYKSENNAGVYDVIEGTVMSPCVQMWYEKDSRLESNKGVCDVTLCSDVRMIQGFMM